MPNRVHNMDLDEISTVDVPANQHGLIVLAKRASQEETVADYFDEAGNPVEDPFELEAGSLVFDSEGQPFEVTDEDDEGEFADEGELAAVGKSAFFRTQVPDASEAIFKSLSAELAKAANEEQRTEVLAKAFQAAEARAAAAEAQLAEAATIAKGERDLRLEREYISKAAEYGMPIPDDEFGPVLKRCAESLSDADCQVLHKAFTAVGEIFKQIGLDGSADMDDPFERIEALANGELDEPRGVAKRAAGDQVISKEAATVAYFDEHPDEYAAYRRELRTKG